MPESSCLVVSVQVKVAVEITAAIRNEEIIGLVPVLIVIVESIDVHPQIVGRVGRSQRGRRSEEPFIAVGSRHVEAVARIVG